MRISSALLKILAVVFLAASFGVGGLFLSHQALASNTNAIYDDSLVNGWESWSWNSVIDFADENLAYSGAKRLLWGPKSWGGLYFHHSEGVGVSSNSKLQFAIRGNETGQKVKITVFGENDQPTSDGVELSKYGGDIETGVWKVYTIPLSDLKATDKKIKGIIFQESAGKDSVPISVDLVEFIDNQQAGNSSVIESVVSGLAQQFIFGQEGLNENWDNWSWKGQLSSVMVFSSSEKSSGLYLHTESAVDGAVKKNLKFEARVDNAGIQYKLMVYGENDQPITEGVNLSDFGGLGTEWKKYQIPLERLGAQNQKIKGVVFQDVGDVRGNLYVNQLGFDTVEISEASKTSPVTVPSVTPAVTLTQSPAPTKSPVVSANNLGGYTTSGGKLYKNNSEISLKGVNWFGFETETHVVHGLWARNYKEIIAQIKSLGFNSVRVPFCPATVRGVSTTSIDYSKNPELKDLNSLAVLDKVVEELNRQELFILLDHHTPDCKTITDLWYTDSYSESAWISDLKTLAGRYKNHDYFMGMDLKNEPHGSVTWGSGNTRTDWNLAAEKAGAEVLKANPNILVFVAGIQDSSKCSDSYGHFWGGNLSVVSCTPINKAMIPENKLVYTPHVYGPDVAHQNYFSEAKFPANMAEIWSKQFGFLRTSGSAAVVPGEWGGEVWEWGRYERY